MSDLRDYVQWHQAYDDPDSGMSWRLGRVREYVSAALDRYPGPVRVVSACAGDGRDVLGVLGSRADADRVSVTLVELHPGLADQARASAASAGLQHVDVRTADAGQTDAFAGAVPADLMLLVGIFGNISDADVHQTIAAAPGFCRPGATVLWSRGRDRSDLNDSVRSWFAEAGFSELDYVTRDVGSKPSLGVLRYDGPPSQLPAGQRLFSFIQ